MLDHGERHFEATGEPLFSSHMLDPSEESLGSNLTESARILLPVWKGLELSERGVAVLPGRTAMRRRRWKPEQKALILLEGLKGRPN
jgi:hypothetical protein